VIPNSKAAKPGPKLNHPRIVVTTKLQTWAGISDERRKSDLLVWEDHIKNDRMQPWRIVTKDKTK